MLEDLKERYEKAQGIVDNWKSSMRPNRVDGRYGYVSLVGSTLAGLTLAEVARPTKQALCDEFQRAASQYAKAGSLRHGDEALAAFDDAAEVRERLSAACDKVIRRAAEDADYDRRVRDFEAELEEWRNVSAECARLLDEDLKESLDNSQ